MRLFKECPKPPHCTECGVHFEPHQYKKYGNLCLTHCRPFVERDSRFDLVMDFARHNWEKLEEQAVAWKKEYEQRMSETMQKNCEAQQRMAGMAGHGYGGVSPFGTMGIYP